MKIVDIAFWAHTTNKNVASFRLRCLNIVNALKSRAVNIEIFDKKNHIPKVLVLSKRYDMETLEYALTLKEKYNTKLILDICDNHFYNPKNNPYYEQKKLELIKAIENVDCVVFSTEALKDEIIKYSTPKEIEVIGDTVEQPVYLSCYFSLSYWRGYFDFLKLKSALKGIKKEYRLIWFGNHGSPNADGGMEDLKIVMEALEKLNLKYQISLTVLSNNKNKYNNLFKDVKLKTIYVEWNNYFFSKFLNLHSISLIPINSNPFTICKTNNRVVTSVIHDLGVVCNCIPSYKEIINCLDDNSSWFKEIEKMFDYQHKNTQVEIVKNNIKKYYSEDAIYDKWHNFLKDKLK